MTEAQQLALLRTGSTRSRRHSRVTCSGWPMGLLLRTGRTRWRRSESWRPISSPPRSRTLAQSRSPARACSCTISRTPPPAFRSTRPSMMPSRREWSFSPQRIWRSSLPSLPRSRGMRSTQRARAASATGSGISTAGRCPEPTSRRARRWGRWGRTMSVVARTVMSGSTSSSCSGRGSSCSITPTTPMALRPWGRNSERR